MSTATPSTMAWVDDMSIVPKRVTGARRAAERLARRFRTPRGACIGHPNDGLDLSDMAQSATSRREIADLRAEIHAEALKDSEVQTAYVTVTPDLAAKSLAISIRAFGSFGSTDVNFVIAADGTVQTIL